MQPEDFAMSDINNNQTDSTGDATDESEAFVFPTSFGQRRLWFLDQLEPGSSAYNISSASRLTGKVDTSALQQALSDLVARHESLRTCFELEEEEPVQIVEESGELPLQVLDGDGGEHQLAQLAKQGFDLSQGPLLRVHLIRQSDNEAVLLLVIHHIIADAWSLGILYKELVTLYEARCKGSAAELPELDIQYGDFAEWQQQWLESDAVDTQLNYWKERLSEAPPVLELPLDHPRPRIQSSNGAVLSRSLNEQTAARLRELAQQEGCTLFILLLAAYQTFLGRLTATEDVIVGTPIAGRSRSELEPLIGFFVNTLAMRADLSDNPSFRGLLAQVKTAAIEAYGNQDLPFEKLVEELHPERLMSYSPVFQALFVLEHAAAETTPFESLRAEGISVKTDSAKFDLSLFVSESPGRLLNTIEYNTDLFNAATIERLLTYFETLLDGIAANPDTPLNNLPLLQDSDKQQLLSGFNQTAVDFGDATTVPAMIAAQAAKTPTAIAIEGLQESLSYSELEQRANRLANALTASGVGRGTRVAISCERSVEMAVAVLAVLKSGAGYVPVDPNYPAERIAYMLRDAACPVVLTNCDISVPESAQVMRLDAFDFTAGPDETPAADASPDDVLYTIYTSGSTGQPKGVSLSHRGLGNLIRWQATQAGLDSPARTLQFASLSFDVSFQELFTTWAQGGTLVLISEELRKDLAALAAFISSKKIERMYMPYAALAPLADVLAERDDLPLALQDVVSAGEQLQVTGSMRKALGRGGARLHNQYGPSETHVVTALTLPDAAADWPDLPSIGYPVANTRCYILDSTAQPVPLGVSGELYLAGVQVAEGYLNRPELTAEKMLPDPFVAGERMYRTGDRARYKDNGEIEFLGRADEQVKFRGFRIEPGEIEALITAMPEVQLAAVKLLGQGADKKLVAYAAGEHLPESSAIRDWLKTRLPDYMVPTHFVVLDEMPLTPSGKVARAQLPEPEWEREEGQIYVAPRTPVEEALVSIWSEVLHIDADGERQVGIHDDFFDMGGHSLLATQVIARIRSVLQAEVPLIHLFEEPTIAGFSRFVEQSGQQHRQEAIPLRTDRSSAALSFSQQRLWFLEQLDPGNPAYNFPIATRFKGQLNIAALEQAIAALLQRHESLRTRFVANGATPLQEVLAEADVTLERIDARGMAQTALFAELTRLSQLPFDLTDAPLLRAHLLECGDDDYILLLGTHHIVSDGWSLSVLYNDFATFYNSAVSGKPADLPELPLHYADYAEWQQSWFKDDVLETQLSFWRDQLADADPVLELPTDKPRPPEQSYRGGSVLRVLSKEVSDGISQLVQEQRSTLFMTLLAAFNVLLARYSRQTSIVVGTPIAGRQRPELEGLIGFFSNTLALHSDLSDNPAFTELLSQVKRNTLAAYDHQDLPFEKLVEELRPERDMSHSPIFQTMFVLQNTPEGDARFKDLATESVNFEMGITKFDLLMEARETRYGLQVGIQYNSDLFVDSTAARMLDHFETLLNSIVSSPSAVIGDLRIISEAERNTVVERFNDTAVDYPAMATPQAMATAQAEKTPDAIALEFGAQSFSYRELNRAANHLAHQLIQQGAAPGSFIGLCAPRSAEALIGLLAILKTGAAYVPLDPDYPQERLHYMIENSGLPLLLTHSSVAAKLPATSTKTVLLDQFDWSAGNDSNPVVLPAADDPLYGIYTSGSTGQPKGAVLPQRSLSNLINWQIRRPGFEHAARTLQYASLSFDVHHQEIFSTWATGGTLVLIDQELRQDLPALVRFIAEQSIQRMWMPFAALQPTAEIMAERDDLTFSLEQMCTSGEQLQVTPLIRKLFGKHPHIGFHNEYGPSEAHVVSVYSFAGSAANWSPLPPIGKPVPNTRLLILDEQQNPCPIGVPGELFISGAQTGTGYLNQPELTAEKFVADPLQPDAISYRSGDLARWLPDGNISYLGRCDDQVKYRGFRIEPGEIEARIAREPGVRLAAVMLREDTPGDKRLVGYITAEPGSAPDPAALRNSLSAALPEYMVPALIVLLDDMPVTPSGKISRRDLPAPEWQGDADKYEPPRNPVEETLAGLWQEILSVERTGIHDDFFDLGGHSLLATQLISRIRDTFGIELPLKYVFRNSTVASLGEQISALQITTGTTSDDQPDDDEMEEFQI